MEKALAKFVREVLIGPIPFAIYVPEILISRRH
jgi:hypothetical protein